MTTLDHAGTEALVARHPGVFHRPLRKRLTGWFLAAGTIAYLCFAWWFFSVGHIISNGNWDIAGVYLADWISYEAQPDIEFSDGGGMTVGFPRFSPFGSDPHPVWITSETAMIERTVGGSAETASQGSAGSQGSFLGTMDSDAVKESSSSSFLGTSESDADKSGTESFPGTMDGKEPANKQQSNGFLGTTDPDAATSAGGASRGDKAAKVPETVREKSVVHARVTIGSGKTIDITPERVTVTRGGETLVLDIVKDESVTPESPLPDWARQKSPGKVSVFFGFAGRAAIEDDEVKIRRRFLGWENFVFDTRSPFWGKPAGEVVSLIVAGPLIDSDRSNLALAWDNFLNNAEWQHGDVWLKLLQTIVMAFAGTVLATILAFPLAFAAARNITRNRILNQVLKRFFDFQRSVDMLIWALFFTRAFGPGPLAGISAIFFTDTGTFGKLYSESLENIDDRQREGVRSVGAKPVLVQRFGVVPQVLPVFLSQSLYFWESNTRSATIIGAVGAGGIGLKLWEAMRTNTDWENVAYMVLLILIVVFVFDNISSFLRHKLIGTQRP